MGPLFYWTIFHMSQITRENTCWDTVGLYMSRMGESDEANGELLWPFNPPRLDDANTNWHVLTQVLTVKMYGGPQPLHHRCIILGM